MKPCTRCNGSGSEPDQTQVALNALLEQIDSAQVITALKDRLRAGVMAYRDASESRVTTLESALRVRALAAALDGETGDEHGDGS